MSIARRALIEAVNKNSIVARFGLLRTRQSSPPTCRQHRRDAWKWNINEGPLIVTNGAYPLQLADGDAGGSKWKITPTSGGEQRCAGRPRCAARQE